MVGTGGYMGRYCAEGIAEAVTLLNADPAQCVRVITAPDLREEGKYAQVKAVAAGSAALKQHVGKAFCQGAHDPIQAQQIPMRCLALSFPGKAGGEGVRKNTIEIPLDIGYLG